MYEYDFFVAGRWQNKDNIIPIVQSVRAAYGMGKKCYAVGIPEKTETLYCIFEKIFRDPKELSAWLKNSEPS